MDSNPVLDKMKRGEATIGTWSTTGDPSVIEVLTHMTDLDWITVDFEQIAYGSGFYEKANDMTLVVIMIEDPVAVDDIDEIMSVPGVDVCFIGPNDLAQTLGVPIGLDNKHPDHIAAVQKVVDAGKRHGVFTGCHTASGEEASRRIKQGMQWFPISSDAGLLKMGVEGQLADVKAGLEGQLAGDSEGGGTFY
jgi:2-keto-3-deoxy-L-rhamnonate aldolase RhmA